mgnify:FL=1
MLDQLLPSGLEMDTRRVGELLTHHPLAIRALLGHLFKMTRAISTRNKCARLVALAVVAAEQAARVKASSRQDGKEVEEDDE